MYEVIGKEVINKVAKSTGLPYTGTILHCSAQDDKVGGYRVKEAYCNGKIDCSNINVGDKVNLYYNQYGKVAFVQSIK